MPAATIKDRIAKPNNMVAKVGCAIYGRGGVGKTSLLRTMPGKGLVLDIPQVEGGTVVLADASDRIDVMPIIRFEEFQEAYDFLASGKHDYQWVAIDSLTAAHILAKRKTVKDRPLDADPMMLEQRDWGKIGELMGTMILLYRSLPLHVIFIAQERTRDSGGVSEMQPDISPATLQALLPSMYLVGRLYTAEVDVGGEVKIERRLRVGPSDRYMTKVRAMPGRDLPAIIRDPNLKNIFAYLLGADVPRPEEVKLQTGFFLTQE